jgi:type I restriction enzyme S subunit
VRAKPYPKHKPSGVEWLGDVPEHWNVLRSDSMVTTAKRQVTPETFAAEEVFHYSIPVVQELGTGAVENGENIASAKQVIDGPVVLVSRLNPRKATICRADPDDQLLTLASTEFVALKATTGDLRFLEYLVSSELFRQRLDSWVQSVTRSHQRARPEEIYRFWNAWPQPHEQRVIAAFLDSETAKIDTLVAKKQTLIERLKEKRAALISRTVTRGLPPDAARAAGVDPNSNFKPSGIAWLGDIPKHWRAKRLKHVLRARKGAIKTGPFGSQLHSSEMLGGEIKVFNQQTVIDRDIAGGDNYISAEKFAELAAFEVFAGDLLITTRGTIGRCMIVSDNAERGILHPCLMRIQIDRQQALDRYVEIVIQESGRVLEQLQLMSNATTIDVIYSEALKEVWIALPPVLEQSAIVAYLDRETTMIDRMVGKVETAIERLQEYRTALITAAVAGKIDVRDQTHDNGVTSQPFPRQLSGRTEH